MTPSSRLSDSEDGVSAQKIDCSGRRRATAFSAGEGSSVGALYAAGPARISMPDHQYVAGRAGPAGAGHRQCRRPRDSLSRPYRPGRGQDHPHYRQRFRHERIIPRNPISLLTLEDGTKMTCRVIDMSLSGAAIAAENRPPLKSLVLLGKVQCRVVRNLDEGFALEFLHEQLAETLEDSVTAR